jgi:hypothetical protein
MPTTPTLPGTRIRASPTRIPVATSVSEPRETSFIVVSYMPSQHISYFGRRGDSKQNSTRSRATIPLETSGLTSDYVEPWPYRRRGEKEPKTALWPARAIGGCDLKPISVLEGLNLPTDLKHAPRASVARTAPREPLERPPRPPQEPQPTPNRPSRSGAAKHRADTPSS